MKILHVCNWASGITTRNVTELKKYSKHQHEIVTRFVHPYDMACEPCHLTEKDTTPEMVIQLAMEADMLHFHAVGLDGSSGKRETIHNINWKKLANGKLTAYHGMISNLLPDGETFFVHDNSFEINNLDGYSALMGPHLSCKKTYGQRLEYVPDMVPIWDWLYMPSGNEPSQIAYTFKDPFLHEQCLAKGVKLYRFPTPTKLTESLHAKRMRAKVCHDNSKDGHWGLFGIESLSQGIPCSAYTHPINTACWDILNVDRPPFLEVEFGGANVPEVLWNVLKMPLDEWQELSTRCRQWVEACYEPKNLVKRWDEIYDQLEKDGRIG
jgi:hypothetical protein